MSEPTTGELFTAKAVTDDEVAAAVDVFMRDPTVSLFRFASGHTVDPAAAVKAYEPAARAVVDPDRSEKFRRRMARTAILLALRVRAVPEASPSVSQSVLRALRAFALYPRGMRLQTYSQVMPKLLRLGYVVDRQARWKGARQGEMGRFITPAGQKLLSVHRAEDNR